MKSSNYKNFGFFTLQVKILVFVLVIFVSVISTLSAQDIRVTGRVTDAKDDAPLIGVSVVVKGTTTGAVTDAQGNYSIDAPSNGILEYSYIGYKTQEVFMEGRTSIDISLFEAIESLDEVVVIGYGVQKKSLVTGAISSVRSDDIITSAMRPEQALQGKVSGVSVTQSSGAPGAGIRVNIRGVGSNFNSNPLYIVDGIKSGDINFINPNDIASMEVLKDAAASAIYGSQGANGVVVITTKSGIAGQSKIEYSVDYGIQSAPQGPKMMDANQYAIYQSEVNPSAANLPNPADWASGSGTNWVEAIAVNAPIVKHNLSFSGGTDRSTHMVSLGYQGQDGIIGGGDFSNFSRISARFNGTHKPNNWIEFGNNIALNHSNWSGITEDEGHNGVVQSALMFDPTTPVSYTSTLPDHVQTLVNDGTTLNLDKNGNIYGISNYMTSGEIYNPYIRLNAQNKNGLDKQNKLLGSVYTIIKPLEGLNITSRFGVDIAYQSFHNYTAPYYGNNDNFGPGLTIQKNEMNWNTWIWENFASYSKSFNDHTFTVIAGVSAEVFQHDWLLATAGPMLRYDPAFAFPDLAATRDGDRIGGSRIQRRMTSQFGRISYDYMGRYQLEATYRRDGSSMFGPNNRFANFPSVSAGWIVSNESFWSLDAINFLKIRASWGQNGSISNLSPDQFRALIKFSGVTYVDGDDNAIPGAEPEVLANPDLKWETSEQTNIGFDISAFDSRLYATFDWFDKITRDLLTPGQITPEFGNFSPWVNAGDISNKGFELLLGYRERKNTFKYDVNFNVSMINNEVIFLNDVIDRLSGAGLPSFSTLTFFEVGQPVWYYRGYKTNGIDPETGDPIVVEFDDENSDGMTNIGSPHHKWYFGANLNAEYKGFDLNVFMQGAAGGKNYIGFIRADRTQVNRLEWFFENRWTPENTNASLPRADYTGAEFFQSDLMVQDASYLKIRQIQLGYTLPASLTNTVKISKIRLYCSLNNFFTFTKYKGWDPEVGSYDAQRQGVDFGFYPTARATMFGVNITL